MKHIYRATLNTCHGLAAAASSEAALRMELVLLALAIPLGLIAAPGAGWYVAMVGVLLVVIAVELLNTAIEKLCDHVTLERHPQIGLVKDLGSAAVFGALCLAGLVWLVALAVRFGFVG